MIHDSWGICGTRPVGSASVLVLLLLSGCASPPVATHAPPPDLQFASSGALDLPRDCEPVAGAVYRTNYLVRPDGQVVEASPASGTGCVQEALRRWVESFRYLPLAGPVTATIDWMAVTGSRGG